MVTATKNRNAFTDTPSQRREELEQLKKQKRVLTMKEASARWVSTNANSYTTLMRSHYAKTTFSAFVPLDLTVQPCI